MALSDARSPEAMVYRRLYWTQRWRTLRALQLRHYPVCAMCKQQGRVTAGAVADHVEPHKGDPVKFFTGRLQTLCVNCHSSVKAREEARGKALGCDADGYPP